MSLHPTEATGIKKLIFKPIIAFTKWFGAHFPKTLVKIRYYARFHKRLNLKNPQTLNDKILYLTLCTDTTEWTRLADKWAVREYVKQCGLEEILIPSVGHWTDINDFRLDALPNSFVLKTTHGSGDVMIVKDKSLITEENIKKQFKPLLSERYGALEGGRHYMRITPALVAEKLIEQDEESRKISSSLIDYKIWCFNGQPQFIWACCNRTSQGTDVMTYDLNWTPHPEFSIFNNEYRHGIVISKPKSFSAMLDVAKKLSTGFPIVRVDLYNLNGKIYFGEMTFTSLGGMMDFYTDEFQLLAGKMVDLSRATNHP